MIHLGLGNYVNAARVLAVTGVKSAPIDRAVKEAREKGLIIDATMGRRTRAALWLDTGHVVLSQSYPQTLAARLGEGWD
jgi:regulator of extracellular matrix RemA (YlzA/DUF370 family)